MKNKKMTRFVTSSMLASTLAFSLGTGAAFANEDETQPTETTIEQVEITEGTSASEQTTDTTADVEIIDKSNTAEEESAVQITEEPVSDEVTEETTTDEESTETDATEQEDTETPSLVPGDFFYFVKLMTEKVRLAFTFDDYKEAQLLADFAAERIAEADALIAGGKSEEAAELLKDAIATQEQAGETLPKSEEGTEETTSEIEDEETNATATETDGEVTEVESKLAHNIDVLMAVLGKVEIQKRNKRL